MEIKEFIKKFDPENQFEVLKDYYKQIDYTRNNKFDLNGINREKITNIVICGLGGSAISGDLVKDVFNDEINFPLLINRNYSLPAFANENTLVIISSYSGNTEETVSCFGEAVKKNCSVVAISTGGRVKEMADESNVPWIELQKGLQPRYALGLSFFTLVRVFQSLNIIPAQDDFVSSVITLWKKKGEEYSKEKNEALKIAEDLIGFIPVIYSCDALTASTGYRLKCQFNENSKLHAFHNVIPELDHNEIIGWETFTEKQLQAKIINIIDEKYHPQIKKRFEITTELARRNGADVITLSSSEENFKVRIMDLIYLGDWITYYLAVLRGFDPSEIDYIHELKQRLA